MARAGSLAYPLMAFENGFFWQAVIARRGSARRGGRCLRLTVRSKVPSGG